MNVLRKHFVAFIDILGFSGMVVDDCQAATTSHKNLDKLIEVHNATKARFGGETPYGLLQFSDSAIIAHPFEASRFRQFVEVVGGHQRQLLERGLLCRGGIAYGWHYSAEGFVFSQGLIEAYHLESSVARYPRIVVSSDLLSILEYADDVDWGVPLMVEDDGAVFVDYMQGYATADTGDRVRELRDAHSKAPSAIREKILWLCNYYDYSARKQADSLSSPRFRRFSRGT